MCKAEGVELYWTSTGKIMAAVCLSAKLVSYRIWYEVTKKISCKVKVILGVAVR